jgi:hypothetical protein
MSPRCPYNRHVAVSARGCRKCRVLKKLGTVHAIAHLVQIASETTATLRGSSVGPLTSSQSVINSIAAVVAAEALDAVFLITRDLAPQRVPTIKQEMRDRHDKRPRPNIRVEGEVT